MPGLVPEGSVILLTGGAGFIGSHITDRLLSCGSKVIIVDDLSTGKKDNINPEAVFYQADITDGAILREIFTSHRIDFVIHEACRINLNVMLEDPLEDVRGSVSGTLNLLKCCVDFKVRKLIYGSSVAVYGRAMRLPVFETDELLPIYSYGIAKKCAEEYVRYYSDYYGLNYSIVRYGNVYGPRQPVYGEVGVIAIYTERAFKGETLIIYGDGSHLRDYIYIDDAVDATLQMLIAGDRETFNVGSGAGVSVKEVFDHFCSVWGRSLQCEHAPERFGELGSFYCDISKLQGAIRFSPQVTIREGIQKTCSYYKGLNLKASSDEIMLRPALPEDKTMIFEWRNTPFLISLGSSGRAVTWQEHCKWFDDIVNKKTASLFIINFSGMPVGQLRFEPGGADTYTASIYLLEEYTGKGMGAIALRKGMALMASEGRRFVAFIKEGNTASRSAFLKAGFTEFGDYANIPPRHIAMVYDYST